MEMERKNRNVDVYGMLRRPSCIIKNGILLSFTFWLCN